MSTKPKTKIRRPSGRSVEEYVGFEQWTYKRWAWEFLRRNPEFQAACDKAGEDTGKRQQVAKRFGLKRFVRYQRQTRRPDWAPEFDSSTVSKWSWIKGREKMPALKFLAGDVVIRFRLAATALDDAALDAQLADAKRYMTEQRTAYLTSIQAEPREAVKAAKPIYFLRNLRLIDLLDGKYKPDREPGRALRLLHERPGAKSPMTDQEASRRFGQKISQARGLVKAGFRLLANREGVPAVAKFETSDISHPVIR